MSTEQVKQSKKSRQEFFLVRFIRSFYFTGRFFVLCGLLAVFCLVAYFYPQLFHIARIAVLVLPCIVLVDLILLYSRPKGIFARRDMMEKLSNGDLNDIRIHLENKYPYPVFLSIVDELPVQFQARNLSYKATIAPFKSKLLTYKVRPVKRGEYTFGAVNVFVKTVLGVLQRRYKFENEQMVPVYPSFIQMRRYELLAISNRLNEAGIKKIRRIGQNREFDTIKDYVAGDDPRIVNWKATARRNRLMVNTYQDEKSQQVYALIDIGRVMKMPFEGLTLLDYAINASLVISNIAMLKYDKAGVVTFSKRVHKVLAAERKGLQMHNIMELLYATKTGYEESDYGRLYATVKQRIRQRSLLLLFTNFETLSSMQRQLSYFRRLAKDHLLVVVFFENTELRAFLDKKPDSMQEIYYQTIAEKFTYEKKLIVKELEKYAIHAVYTSPQNLTVNTINKYLELKARGLI
ncbi:MAG: DUF58 domain-containing protein [Bacteroidota bacterium]|nr:DUF58 domain-containing protein [Bacteroidota bacterium]